MLHKSQSLRGGRRYNLDLLGRTLALRMAMDSAVKVTPRLTT